MAFQMKALPAVSTDMEASCQKSKADCSLFGASFRRNHCQESLAWVVSGGSPRYTFSGILPTAVETRRTQAPAVARPRELAVSTPTPALVQYGQRPGTSVGNKLPLLRCSRCNPWRKLNLSLIRPSRSHPRASGPPDGPPSQAQ